MTRSGADPDPILAGWGLRGAPAAGLRQYLDLLATWSARVNLSGARTTAQRLHVLIEPVIPLASLLRPGRLLDVGSGNGSPGFVLALLRPDLAVTLLEPRARRWAFLREAARSVRRNDICVLRLRHEGYTGPPAQNVTLRALKVPLRELARLVEPGGRVFVLGEAPAADPGFVRQDSPGARLHVFRPR